MESPASPDRRSHPGHLQIHKPPKQKQDQADCKKYTRDIEVAPKVFSTNQNSVIASAKAKHIAVPTRNGPSALALSGVR